MSSKDFLKRVEQLMKKKTSASATDLRHATNDLRCTTDRHPSGSSTSIYAQQQYLPYPNHHPTSDFVPRPIATARHSSLHNNGNAPTSPNGGSGNHPFYYHQQHDPDTLTSPLRSTPAQHFWCLLPLCHLSLVLSLHPHCIVHAYPPPRYPYSNIMLSIVLILLEKIKSFWITPSSWIWSDTLSLPLYHQMPLYLFF